MTNKEILAELKICYELLNDIDDNGNSAHCNGQLNKEQMGHIYKAMNELEEVYSDFRATLDDKEMEVKVKDEIYHIGNYINEDYSRFYDEELQCTSWVSCGDIDYYWYYDELGYGHNNFEYDKLANGFIKALDEICQLSKEVGKDFDYFDKASELVDFNNSDTLELLDKYGSDNDE